MGLWSWFARRRNPATAAGHSVFAAAIEPKEQEPLTPERVAELKAAWAELAEAAKESAVTGFMPAHGAGSPGRKIRQLCGAWRRYSAASTRRTLLRKVLRSSKNQHGRSCWFLL